MYTGKCLSPERSGIIGKSRDYNDYCCLWQLKEKDSLCKGCHRTFKQLLRDVQMNKMRPDVDEREIIRENFSKILELGKGANYVVPFERYMKKYKLNGYYS